MQNRLVRIRGSTDDLMTCALIIETTEKPKLSLLYVLILCCFLNTGGVNIGRRRRIKSIKFAGDIALLAENGRIPKNMLMELNDRRRRPWLSEENK